MQGSHIANYTALNEVENNYLNHSEQALLANALNNCRSDSCKQDVQDKFQKISDANNAKLTQAKNTCDTTGNCIKYNKLVHNGTAIGKGTGVENYDDPDPLTPPTDRDKEANKQAANQTYKELIDRKLNEEVTYVNTGFDDVGTTTEQGHYDSAITAENIDTAGKVFIIGALAVIPSPEDLVIGAVLVSKAGKKLAEVVWVNGRKLLKLFDGKVIGKGVAGKVKDPVTTPDVGGKGKVSPAKRDSDTIVLGKTENPNYADVAKEKGYRNFGIPDKIWKKMDDDQKWAANEKFLDRAISRGDKIKLSHNPHNPKVYNKTFKKEIEYLKAKGYKVSEDGKSMIKK